jgi:Domain of unknown function (DUF4333)
MNHHLRKVTARTAVGVIGSLALVTVGCGSTKVHHTARPVAASGKARQVAAIHALTPATAETQIAALQQRIGLSVTAVHCPRGMAIQDGHPFTCITTLARGGPIKTTVTPTRAELGDARFQFPLRNS